MLFSSLSDNRIISFHSCEYNDYSVPSLHEKDSGFLMGYVLSGEICIEAPEYLITAGIGELFILHPSEECVIYRNKSDVAVITLSVSALMLDAMYDVLLLPRVFVSGTDELDKFLKAESEYKLYKAGGDFVGRGLTELVISIILDAATAKALAPRGKKVTAEAVKDHLDLCLCGDTDLDTIGKKFGVTGMHIIRLFKAKYDVTPMYYLKTARLNKAASLLSTSNMTIKEIAGLLRFSGTQHFTNLFREQFGTSPGKYREKTKANEHRR